jgi:Xaa-Pro aminopeptidase
MKTEISSRIQRFQERIASQDLDGALIVQKMDLYYLSGTDQDAHLWVPREGEPLLLVRKSLARARMDSPLEHMMPFKGPSQLPERILAHSGSLPRRLGLEMDVLPAALYSAYRKRFPDADMADISTAIRRVRMVKSDFEIAFIRRAAAVADRLFERVPSFLEDAETETDLALRVEAFYRAEGHPGFVRTRTFNMECNYGQLTSGRWSAFPGNSTGATGGKGAGAFFSQSASREKIEPHSPIMLDYAANMEGYICDQTRIFSKGSLDDKFHRAHAGMTAIQDALAREARPGTVVGDLYALAKEMAADAGLSEGFMGYPDPVPFVGHGVGLEIDEWPPISPDNPLLLEPGMVMAMEPKYLFPDEGFVGVESTWVVTDDGLEKLNQFPDAIVECPV